MRKIVLGLVFLSVVLLVLPAGAATLTLPTSGPIKANFYDNTNLFDGDGEPRPITLDSDLKPVFTLPAIGDENRTAFLVNSISQSANTFYSHTATSVELSGLLYNLELVARSLNADGSLTLYFAEALRNPLLDSKDVDGDITTLGINHGGVVEIYLDEPAPTGTPYDVTPGPGSWSENGSTNTDANDLHNAVDADAYPTVTDGDLWLAGVLVEMPGESTNAAGIDETIAGNVASSGEAIVWVENLAGDRNSGSGRGFMNVFGGDFQASVGRGVYNASAGGLGADISLQSDLYFPFTEDYLDNDLGDSKWQVVSNDPVNLRIVAIPEPTIMLLFGASIVGGFIRRRRSL